MDPNALRRTDFSLSEDQSGVRELLADVLAKYSPLSVAREAQPLGFDAEVWRRVVEVGMLDLAAAGAQPDAGDDEPGLIELCLAAEEIGRTVAPVPLLDHVVALRLLLAADDAALADLVDGAMDGSRILAFSTRPFDRARLVPVGAIAQDVVGFDGTEIIVVTADEPREHAANQASLPAAWVDPRGERVRRVTTSNADALFARAQSELKVLTASALVGITEGALALGLEFVKSRVTMGVFIGVLQGVSFPLADVYADIAGARNLALRTAWFLEHEPAAEPWLPESALLVANDIATRGTTTSQHVQGGLGFTVEADASLYFLRAKGWALAAGDPLQDARTVGSKRLMAAARSRDLAPAL